MRRRLKKFLTHRPDRPDGADFRTDRRMLGGEHRRLRPARGSRDLSRQRGLDLRTDRPDRASRPRWLLFGVQRAADRRAGRYARRPPRSSASIASHARVVWVEFTPDRFASRAGSHAQARAPPVHFLTYPNTPNDRCGHGRAGWCSSVSRPPRAGVRIIPMFRYHALGGVSLVAIQLALLAPASVAMAQSADEKVLPPVTVDAPRPAKRAARKPAGQATAARRATQPAVAAPERQLPVVVVDTAGAGANASLGTPAAVARFQLPQKSYSITAKEIDETINLKDPEDAVKYMPSLFVRKRNDGDNQAVLATRSWGLNSSARTLIYYDDLLISALIGNNNSGASPKWNLISPEAIGRDRFPQRPVRGCLSRQLDRRRAADHIENAGQAVRGRQGDGVGDAVESVRHQRHLCDQPDQRRGGQPQRPAVLARHRELSRQLPAAADLYDQRHHPRLGNHRGPFPR